MNYLHNAKDLLAKCKKLVALLEMINYIGRLFYVQNIDIL